MPNSPIDWPTIRFQFEHGASKNTLAGVHGVSRQAIIKRARQEGWVVQQVTSPVTPVTDEIDTSAPAIAEQARSIIATYMQQNPDYKVLKMLMDSLSQAHKIELTSPSDKPTASGTPLELMPFLTNEQLSRLADLRHEMDEILETATAQKLEANTGIMSIRKKAMG
jgi:hypothetical protein